MTKLQRATLGAWILYIPYYFIMRRWEQTVIAPIRIDLLFVYTLLALLTIATLIQWLINYYKLRH